MNYAQKWSACVQSIRQIAPSWSARKRLLTLLPQGRGDPTFLPNQALCIYIMGVFLWYEQVKLYVFNRPTSFFTSDWPGLCLFCCYQPSCVVNQHSWFGLLFHKISNFNPPPPPQCDGLVNGHKVAEGSRADSTWHSPAVWHVQGWRWDEVLRSDPQK